jgi:hypothetical protein
MVLAIGTVAGVFGYYGFWLGGSFSDSRPVKRKPAGVELSGYQNSFRRETHTKPMEDLRFEPAGLLL